MDSPTEEEKNNGERYRRTMKSSIMTGRQITRMQSVGWTINKLRFQNLGIHGRSEEIATLEGCLQRVARSGGSGDAAGHRKTGQNQVVWIGGVSGSGKSTLASTLEKKVQTQKGIFATGKFDFQQRDQPYAGILDACRDIIAQILAMQGSNPIVYENVQKQLFQTFRDGVKLKFLSSVYPDLGKQPGNLTALQRDDDDNNNEKTKKKSKDLRWNEKGWQQAIMEFLEITATSSVAPLVLVLDDLQWADQESLELIELLIQNKQYPLMIVGCYRSNEVTETHFLSTLIKKLRVIQQNQIEEEPSADFDMKELSLENLSVLDANRVLMDLLAVDDESVTLGLATICHRRTNGNVFYLIAFLSMLKERGLLEYSLGLMRWTWTDETIERETVASRNVVDLIKSKMNTAVKTEVRRILEFAACLGASFGERLISILWDELVSEESRRGFDNFNLVQLLEVAVAESFLDSRREANATTVYRWVHDRVQEAAMSLVDPQKRGSLKFDAGMVLANNLSDAELDASIFVVCNLLNEASMLPTDPEQKIQIAELNLQAAKKAIEFSAFSLAKKLASRGIEMLPEEGAWENHKELTLDLHSTSIELENILGLTDQMQRHSRVVLEQKRCTIVDKLRVYHALVDGIGNDGRTMEGQKLCFDVLKRLGCRFPASPPKTLLLVAYGLLRARNAAKDLDRIMAPKMDIAMDALTYETMKFLDQVTVFCFETLTDKLPLVILKMLKLTSEKGICEYSPQAFVNTGILMVRCFDDFQVGRQYSQFAMKLATTHSRVKSEIVEVQCLLRTSIYIDHFSRPYASLLKPMLRCYEVALQKGDNETAMFGMFTHCMLGFLAGKPLECIAQDVNSFVNQMAFLKKVTLIREALLFWRFLLQLMGRSDEPTRRADSLNQLQARGSSDHLELQRNKIQLDATSNLLQTIKLVYFGDYQNAAELAMRGNDDIRLTLIGTPNHAVDHFYKAMALLAGMPTAKSPVKKLQYKREAIRLYNIIKDWVQRGNLNLRHHQILLEAELAALDKKTEKALESFRHAAVQSARAGLVHEAALANERFGLFLLYDLKDREAAKFQIEEASRLYSEWGASRKVELLLGTYAQCLVPDASDD